MRTFPAVAAIFHIVIATLLLSACGGHGSQAISGGAIKGPLINATVSVYAFDNSQPGFKGALIDSGSTDANAAITGLDLPKPLTPPYIMEFTSTPGTTIDLSTGMFPIIATLSTVLTQTLIDSGKPVYATPLTALAVNIAIDNATTSITAAEFEASLPTAALQVVNSMGFGMSPSINIFSSPPVVDNNVDTQEELADVLAYRSAIEALAAITFQMQADASTTATAEEIFQELGKDVRDGVIDANVNGSASTVYGNTTLAIFTQDPSTLIIPNMPNNETVAEVNDILVAEAASTGSTANTTELSNGSITVIVSPASTSVANKTDWGNFNWGDGSVWR